MRGVPPAAASALLLICLALARAGGALAAEPGAAAAAPVATETAPAPAAAVDPAATLETVVVSGRRMRVETLIDRKVYHVDQDVQSTFGSVSDVLSTLPSVEVDGDGAVSLRGDANVLILVDGKPSALFSGASAGENLLALPAQDIERIEVLTTPPPQYKADGAAGVINIITRRQRGQGASGQLQASLGVDGREILGASGQWRSGALKVSASAGFRQEFRQREVRSEVQTPATGAAPAGDSRTSIDEIIRRTTPTLGMTAEYAVDDRHTLSASLSWLDRGGLRTYRESSTTQVDGAGVTVATQRLSAGHDPETDGDVRVGWSTRFADTGGTLDLTLHRSGSRQHEHYDYADTTLVPATAVVYDNLGFLEVHAITDVGADYVRPLGDGSVLKLGYAYQLDNYAFSNLAFLLDPASGAFQPDTGLSNDFQFRQRLHALYASWQGEVHDWTWLGGVRFESVRTEAWQITDHSYHPDSYLRAYPSLHAEHPVSEQATLSFGASERITRPAPEVLNPYVDHEYTPNLQAGNPLLRPQLTQSFEAGVDVQGKDRSVALTAYWRRNRDGLTDVTEYLGNGFSLTTKTNLPRSEDAGLEFSANARLAQAFSISLSGNAFRSQIDASALGAPGLQSTTGVNGKLRLDYQASPADFAQLSVTRSARRLTPQGSVAAINLVNLGLRHTLSRRLKFVATVSDIFNGQRFQRVAVTPGFTSAYQRHVQGQVAYAGLVLSLGTTRKGPDPASFDYDE